jgi:hypothetical protein
MCVKVQGEAKEQHLGFQRGPQDNMCVKVQGEVKEQHLGFQRGPPP